MEVFPFEIYTPYRLFYKGEVEFIVIRLMDGEAGVYANHAPFTAPVSIGLIKMKDKKGVLKHAFLSDGIIEVKKHKAVVLVDSANWPEEIDAARALAAKADAEKTMTENSFKFDKEAAAKKLKRAETRLKLHELTLSGAANA